MQTSSILKPSLNWLLVFVPLALGLNFFTTNQQTYIFITACLAIIPLAGWMGKATEHLAEKTGDGVGGLLNATFGNAAELIIAIVALSKGMHEIVKASLTGSIIGNILLVLGLSFFCGGAKFKIQKFNAPAVRAQASSLTLAAIALVLPAAYHYIYGQAALIHEHDLSLLISLVLIATYILTLFFSLHTHKQLFIGTAAEAAKVEEEEDAQSHHQAWSLKKSLSILFIATAFVALISEVLVASVEHAAHTFGMTNVFIGVIVVAIIGNAAEHSTAILVAMKNRMDLAIGIAVGSSIQIALFAAPVLVFASYFIAPTPLDLVFTPFEVLAVVISVAIAGQVTGDGESNWLEGVQLLSVYLILAIAFYFVPELTH